MKIEKRTEKTKELRESKIIPGVIYGKGIDSTPIQVSEVDFTSLYRQYGETMTFEIKLGRKKHIVYIKDLQRSKVKYNQILHFDLQKVSETDIMTADIYVHPINDEKIKQRGQIVHLVLETLETEYPVGKGISRFDVSVEGLELDDVIKVKDIEVPEGFKILDDPEETVLSISYPTIMAEETDEEEVDPSEVEAINQSTDDEEDEDKE
jgi:large subunit ribosomal protein L25